MVTDRKRIFSKTLFKMEIFENALVLYSCGYQLLDTSKWARSHQRRYHLNHFQLLLRFHGARFLGWGTLFDKCARNTYRLHVDTIVFMTFIASCKRCSCSPLRYALWLQSFRLYNTGEFPLLARLDNTFRTSAVVLMDEGVSEPRSVDNHIMVSTWCMGTYNFTALKASWEGPCWKKKWRQYRI